MPENCSVVTVNRALTYHPASQCVFIQIFFFFSFTFLPQQLIFGCGAHTVCEQHDGSDNYRNDVVDWCGHQCGIAMSKDGTHRVDSWTDKIHKKCLPMSSVSIGTRVPPIRAIMAITENQKEMSRNYFRR